MIKDLISRDEWILSVETSGRNGSVALGRDGQLVQEVLFSAPLKHSAELFAVTLTMLNSQGLKASDIKQVYISYGPGSFTGLRIAVTVAKMYSFANDAKIVPVNTLQGVAMNVFNAIKDGIAPPSRVAAILDAKRGQFFVAIFNIKNDKIIRASEDMLITAAEFVENFASPDQPTRLLGEGLVYYKDNFQAPGFEILNEKYWPARAANILHLGWEQAEKGDFIDPYVLIPHYVRGPEAVAKAGMTPIREI
ncbi:MAG: tRNA (adenosine(37)-N6)-threonylcarbamoyltransferase complex dimerization subunit type 1 TsaB [Planctomycetes bacterium GWF2_50_10]|nr:MAG: tRNA (adenosine(37)-N6)-threonylcarbamoyltransferase complex dimerization subunit type 1 TsaB [Planctomycetes bacterium GWF2_50_10]